jgi:hypothetical protein
MRGYALGAVDFLLAPVMPNVLRSKVAVCSSSCFNSDAPDPAAGRTNTVALVRETGGALRSRGSRAAGRTSSPTPGKFFISSLDLRALMAGTMRLRAVPLPISAR